jgi:hypothetical protein
LDTREVKLIRKRESFDLVVQLPYRTVFYHFKVQGAWAINNDAPIVRDRNGIVHNVLVQAPKLSLQYNNLWVQPDLAYSVPSYTAPNYTAQEETIVDMPTLNLHTHCFAHSVVHMIQPHQMHIQGIFCMYQTIIYLLPRH